MSSKHVILVAIHLVFLLLVPQLAFAEEPLQDDQALTVANTI